MLHFNRTLAMLTFLTSVSLEPRPVLDTAEVAVWLLFQGRYEQTSLHLCSVSVDSWERCLYPRVAERTVSVFRVISGVWETPRHFQSPGSHLQRPWVSFLFSLESVLPKKVISPSVVRYCFYNSGVGWGGVTGTLVTFWAPTALQILWVSWVFFFFFFLNPSRKKCFNLEEVAA